MSEELGFKQKALPLDNFDPKVDKATNKIVHLYSSLALSCLSYDF